MVISDFAIKRPVITVVTMLALVVFGIFALLRLQTDEFPDVRTASPRKSSTRSRRRSSPSTA
jgi:multidrug efflux pump subunit AcrB